MKQLGYIQTKVCVCIKRSAQVQYNYNTTAIQELFFLYCSCIARADRFTLLNDLSA